MRSSTRIAAFGAALVLVFVAAGGIGRAVGPIGRPAEAHDAAGEGPGHGADSQEQTASTAAPPPGLSSAQDGYRLVLDTREVPLGVPTPLRFRIVGPDRRALTSYAVEQEKELHLVVVRRDGAAYQHLHPTRDADGVWSVPVTVAAAGQYKLFADFAPAGRDDGITLAGDLAVAGAFRPQPVERSGIEVAVDGYTVELPQVLDAAADTAVSLTVRKDGRPVTDLEPYLGAYGHLVVLRSSDLAYLHVHPEGEPGDGRTASGPTVRFVVETPSADDYRLYFEFKHGGVVRTAEFTRVAR